MAAVFSVIRSVTLPDSVDCESSSRRNRPFVIKIVADGMIPFPQVILRQNGIEQIVNGAGIVSKKSGEYTASVPGGIFEGGMCQVQVEGCRVADLAAAKGEDWIKWFGEVRITSSGQPRSEIKVKAEMPAPQGGVKVYFGIHKHMHQPFYQAADQGYWDGEKDSIFGSRQGAYTRYVPGAVRQYIDGGLPHAGLSTSWSGSLIEQLDRCDRDGLCGGGFSGWKNELREFAAKKTALGNARTGFSSFGHFHPLMALIPGRDIVRQIEWHRKCILSTFGAEPIKTIFPPETAFHVRMIPSLVKSGLRAVMYDSIHRFRACKEYPYAGMSEGMLPPSPADQENPPVKDWLQLQNIWAGSKISPSLLRPEYVKYEDSDGVSHSIIAVPAERYIGNEDARGGYGALLYEAVLGQVYDNIVQNRTFDPAHPPFFILHSDGDNYGGGADSYYFHNTGNMVNWLKHDPRFELSTIDDYLDRFPPEKKNAVHIEPGSWSGADNGDPQFRKWFSRYDQPYSPDLNSWAVLTMLQNAVHTLEDAGKKGDAIDRAVRLMLTAETSCYWYWTGQDVWDAQVTNAANAAWSLIDGEIDALVSSGKDKSGPTIFPPWLTPENPGGKTWGNNCLVDAAKTGTVHVFAADISGVAKVTLVIKKKGKEEVLPMTAHGPYRSDTGARRTADYFTCQLPAGMGDIRYFIRAIDGKGNISTGSLERAFLA